MVLSPSVLAGFLRVMTDRRIFVEPVAPMTAVAFVDELLAASAIELGLTWVSFDRGFARFRALRWLNPVDG